MLFQKSKKKVRGVAPKKYNNPVKPQDLPRKPFIPSTAEEGLKPGDKARYQVVVKTGSLHNCGTDAEVG